MERGQDPKGKEGHKMKVTYWKENRTGIIYKYFGESKPYRSETAWKRVTANDYFEQIAHNMNK